MYKLILKLGMLLGLIVWTSYALAETGDVKILSISNPSYNSGIQIGDVLTRKISIQSGADDELSTSALPMKGSSQSGIELRDVNVTSSKNINGKLHTIVISYQVFASAAKPVQMQLPLQHIQVKGKHNVTIDIPAWRFWYSPLVAQGLANAKAMMQPQIKPDLIAIQPYQIKLGIFIGLLAISLLGLIYVNADKYYLPFMNGVFAQAHRKIKKLAKTNDKAAFAYIHQAFNKLYGANLFASELDHFLAVQPKFVKMKGDINTFFAQSNAALFANKLEASAVANLLDLSKRLRDCERGV
jgi:mxaA protein